MAWHDPACAGPEGRRASYDQFRIVWPPYVCLDVLAAERMTHLQLRQARNSPTLLPQRRVLMQVPGTQPPTRWRKALGVAPVHQVGSTSISLSRTRRSPPSVGDYTARIRACNATSHWALRRASPWRSMGRAHSQPVSRSLCPLRTRSKVNSNLLPKRLARSRGQELTQRAFLTLVEFRCSGVRLRADLVARSSAIHVPSSTITSAMSPHPTEHQVGARVVRTLRTAGLSVDNVSVPGSWI